MSSSDTLQTQIDAEKKEQEELEAIDKNIKQVGTNTAKIEQLESKLEIKKPKSSTGTQAICGFVAIWILFLAFYFHTPSVPVFSCASSSRNNENIFSHGNITCIRRSANIYLQLIEIKVNEASPPLIKVNETYCGAPRISMRYSNISVYGSNCPMPITLNTPQSIELQYFFELAATKCNTETH